MITEAPAYDAADPYHVRLWELAGKPDLVELDSEGHTWRPTVTKLLGPEGYERRELPPAAPVTDVEIMTPLFIERRRWAAVYMDGLKGQVWSYLKNEKSMDPDAVTEAGALFCEDDDGIGKQYDYFVRAGGHPVAALKLWTRIQEIKADFAWFDSGVNGIFAAGLGQS